MNTVSRLHCTNAAHLAAWHKKSLNVFQFRLSLSGWQDSNLRPPHPKCGAIPGYATPRLAFFLHRIWRNTIPIAIGIRYTPISVLVLYRVWRDTIPIAIGIRYTPIAFFGVYRASTTPLRIPSEKLAEREGFEPSIRVNPVCRFSKPVVSATHPSLLLFFLRIANVNFCTNNTRITKAFFYAC